MGAEPGMVAEQKVEATIEATIIRADGTREELGVLTSDVEIPDVGKLRRWLRRKG